MVKQGTSTTDGSNTTRAFFNLILPMTLSPPDHYATRSGSFSDQLEIRTETVLLATGQPTGRERPSRLQARGSQRRSRSRPLPEFSYTTSFGTHLENKGFL